MGYCNIVFRKMENMSFGKMSFSLFLNLSLILQSSDAVLFNPDKLLEINNFITFAT